MQFKVKHSKFWNSNIFLLLSFIMQFHKVVSSQSEGLGKMGLGIVKYFYDHPSQPNRGQLVHVQFFHGQLSWTCHCKDLSIGGARNSDWKRPKSETSYPVHFQLILIFLTAQPKT